MQQTWNTPNSFTSSKNFEILIIDQNDALTSVFKKVLTSRGYQVTILNKFDNIFKLTSEKSFDAIFFDGPIDGFSKEFILNKFYEAGILNNSRVILFSGTNIINSIQTERLYKLYDYLEKPSKIEIILDLLKKIQFDKQRQVTPSTPTPLTPSTPTPLTPSTPTPLTPSTPTPLTPSTPTPLTPSTPTPLTPSTPTPLTPSTPTPLTPSTPTPLTPSTPTPLTPSTPTPLTPSTDFENLENQFEQILSKLSNTKQTFQTVNFNHIDKIQYIEIPNQFEQILSKLSNTKQTLQTVEQRSFDNFPDDDLMRTEINKVRKELDELKTQLSLESDVFSEESSDSNSTINIPTTPKKKHKRFAKKTIKKNKDKLKKYRKITQSKK